MQAIETSASFDDKGNIIIENQPELKNKKVKLLILIDEEKSDQDLYSLSSHGLANAYTNEEPAYDLSLIKEPNEVYAGR